MIWLAYMFVAWSFALFTIGVASESNGRWPQNRRESTWVVVALGVVAGALWAPIALVWAWVVFDDWRRLR